MMSDILKISYIEAIFAPPPYTYYSRLSFKQAIWYAVLTSQVELSY